MSHTSEIRQLQKIGRELRRSSEWVKAKLAYRKAETGSPEEQAAYEQMNRIAAKFFRTETPDV